MSFYEMSQLKEIDQILLNVSNYQKHFKKVFDTVQKENIQYIEKVVTKIHKILTSKKQFIIKKLLAIRLTKQLIPTASYSLLVLVQALIIPELDKIALFKRELSNEQRGKILFMDYEDNNGCSEQDKILFGKSVMRITLELIKCCDSWIPCCPYQKQVFPSMFSIKFQELVKVGIKFPDYQYIKQQEKQKYFTNYNKKTKSKSVIIEDYKRQINAKFESMISKPDDISEQETLLNILGTGDMEIISFIVDKCQNELYNHNSQQILKSRILEFVDEAFLLGEIQLMKEIEENVVPWMVENIFAVDLIVNQKIEKCKVNNKDFKQYCIILIGVWSKFIKVHSLKMFSLLQVLDIKFRNVKVEQYPQMHQIFQSNFKQRQKINDAKIKCLEPNPFTLKQAQFLKDFFNSKDIRNTDIILSPMESSIAQQISQTSRMVSQQKLIPHLLQKIHSKISDDIKSEKSVNIYLNEESRVLQKPKPNQNKVTSRIEFSDSFIKSQNKSSSFKENVNISTISNQGILCDDIPISISKPSFGFNTIFKKQKISQYLIEPKKSKVQKSIQNQNSKIIEPELSPYIQSYYTNSEIQKKIEEIRKQKNPKFINKKSEKPVDINKIKANLHSLNKLRKTNSLSSHKSEAVLKQIINEPNTSQLAKHYQQRIARLQSDLQCYKKKELTYISEISNLKSEIHTLKSNSVSHTDDSKQNNKQKSKQLSYLLNQNALLKAKLKRLESQIPNFEKSSYQLSIKQLTPKVGQFVNTNLTQLSTKLKKSLIRSKDLLLKNQILQCGMIIKQESNLNICLYYLFSQRVSEFTADVFSPDLKFTYDNEIKSIAVQEAKQQKQFIKFNYPLSIKFKLPILNLTFKLNTKLYTYKIELPINILRYVQYQPVKIDQFNKRFPDNLEYKYYSTEIQYSKRILKQPSLLLQIIPGAVLLNPLEQANFYKKKSNLIYGFCARYNKNCLMIKLIISPHQTLYLEAIQNQQISLMQQTSNKFVEVYFQQFLSILIKQK